MSISFSGLASGLDTSSWVESLVALKRAKVTTLEEERSGIELTQSTLSSIKSFFSSFRSMLEKVTDTKLGIPSMDLFAQNLANKLNVVVEAPTKTVWAYPSGRVVVAGRRKDNPQLPDYNNRGTFKKFYPGGKKK